LLGGALGKTGSRKVVLFLPPYAGKVLGPPLGLLSLAASLRESGYEPCIIDGALDRNYFPRLAREIEHCLCFGVSLLTGPMIREAAAAARFVKQARPDIPVIFGGWHPSLLPGQTLSEDFVDIVVRHQGDRTLVEILQRLEAGQLPDMVQGCWFKRGRQIHQNPDRPALPISSLPIPAYDLADVAA
jgi:anaerobic magnesium-protoporphyrin IX monomethyl ester cyclase